MRSVGIIGALLTCVFLISVASAASVGWSAKSRFYVGSVMPNQLYDIGLGYAFNPGDAYQCYVMDVAYIYNQPEKHPPKEWLLFAPASFCLEAGAGLSVDIDLRVDPGTKIDGGLKGDYFAFIGPCTYDGNVGACAASRLYFTVGKQN